MHTVPVVQQVPSSEGIISHLVEWQSTHGHQEHLIRSVIELLGPLALGCVFVLGSWRDRFVPGCLPSRFYSTRSTTHIRQYESALPSVCFVQCVLCLVVAHSLTSNASWKVVSLSMGMFACTSNSSDSSSVFFTVWRVGGVTS